MHRSRVWLAATLWLVSSAFPQDAFVERRRELLARQPASIQFSLTAEKTDFYLGEQINLQLTFTSPAVNKYLADTRLNDRIGRMNYVEEFIAAPASRIEDPLQGTRAASGGLGGITGAPVILSEKPFTFARVLNEWVRFTQPGQYRVYVISRRVSAVDKPSKPLELVSNVLTVDIRAAPEAWIKQQIAAVRVTLAASGDRDSSSIYLGVLASPYRKQLLPLMEQRLIAADQPVSQAYLNTLAELRTIVGSGAPQRAAARVRNMDDYVARLIRALPAKQPRARAASLHTLLNLGLRDGGSEPAWLPTVVRSLIADFRSLPVLTQTVLLEHRWSVLNTPQMLPVLRSLVANPPPDQFEAPIRTVALRRLYQISPVEGRKFILAEIAKPEGSHIAFSTLAMLPDAYLPELDRVLAAKFDPLLIVRYATGSVVEQIKRRVEESNAELRRQKLPSCIGPIAFYFFKHDPPYAERLLREQFEAASSPPACYDMGFQLSHLGRWAYSPAFERFAVQSLTSPKVPVKRGAAEVLGTFGSAAAQNQLWKAMEYFRSWWNGREQELRVNGENVQLERALRTALASADGWTLQAPELMRLLNLCSTEWCRTEVQNWITACKSPINIAILSDWPDEQVYTIGWYGPGDEQWLRRKLLQFPQGAAFQLSKGPTSKPARDRIADIVRVTGRRLVGAAQ